MNHLLISQLAHDVVTERIREAERDRLIRTARAIAPAASGSGLRDVARRLAPVPTSWRQHAESRATQGPARPCPAEPCAEGHAS
jgi:hypothetical protein